jgi:hypothetical protein
MMGLLLLLLLAIVARTVDVRRVTEVCVRRQSMHYAVKGVASRREGEEGIVAVQDPSPESLRNLA